MTHEQARKELQKGTAPELICATCPWDRLCVEPPRFSSAEFDRKLDEALKQDEASDPDHKSAPARTLLTVLTLAGRDSAGPLCPVFALRLQGPDGRKVADDIRHTMRTWDKP